VASQDPRRPACLPPVIVFKLLQVADPPFVERASSVPHLEVSSTDVKISRRHCIDH
jgi:hypothetical protein